MMMMMMCVSWRRRDVLRRKQYKMMSVVDAEETRQIRREEISKNKREQSLLKKRLQVVPSSSHHDQPLISSSTTTAAPPQPSILSTLEIKLENLPCMIAGVYSNDRNTQLEATTLFRKLLSIEPSPPIEEVIQSGVVPLFIEFFMREDFPQLQFEAAWALTNIAIAISDHVAVPFILKLLASRSDDDLREQMHENAKLLMLRNATWTLSNFCRGKPHPPLELRKAAVVDALERLLVHSNDEEVLANTCWALSYLSADDKIQAVIQALSGVCQRLVELLKHPSSSVLIPALLTVANILTRDGDDVQPQVPLVNLLQTAEFDIKKEVAWAISKATSGGDNEQIKYLVNRGCIKPLCDLLSCPDPRIVSLCLQGLDNILKVGEVLDKKKNLEDVNFFAQLIDEAEGLEKIENLQSHDNHEICEKAVKILETYYWLEEEDDEPVERFRCCCTTWIQLIWRIK